MNLEIQEDSEADSSWNSDLLKSPLGNIYHTEEYANYVRTSKGWNTSFVRIFNSGNLVAQNLIVYYPRGQNRNGLSPTMSFAKNVAGPIPLRTCCLFQTIEDFSIFLYKFIRMFEYSYSPFFFNNLTKS